MAYIIAVGTFRKQILIVTNSFSYDHLYTVC